MGGLARAAGAARLNGISSGPRWLIGGNATLVVAPDAPTLWLVDIDDPATRDRAEAIALLPGEAASFASRSDAAERLLRRRLARSLLAAAGGYRPDQVVVATSPAGAPLVKTPGGWHVSVAAHWPACLIGIARHPLGVDVERVDDRPLALDLLTPGERENLAAAASADRMRQFARTWVAKESHAKWTGDPLRVDPESVETTETRVASPWGETPCWRHDRGDLVAAVCTGG